MMMFRCASCGTHQNAPFDPTLSHTIRISFFILVLLLSSLSTVYYVMKQHSKVSVLSVEKNNASSFKYDIFFHLIIQSYLEGSTLEGPLYWDTVWFGGNIEDEAHIPIGSIDSASLYGIPQEFGCFTKLRGLFQKQLADGIIGLAPRGKFCE